MKINSLAFLPRINDLIGERILRYRSTRGRSCINEAWEKESKRRKSPVFRRAVPISKCFAERHFSHKRQKKRRQIAQAKEKFPVVNFLRIKRKRYMCSRFIFRTSDKRRNCRSLHFVSRGLSFTLLICTTERLIIRCQYWIFVNNIIIYITHTFPRISERIYSW